MDCCVLCEPKKLERSFTVLSLINKSWQLKNVKLKMSIYLRMSLCFKFYTMLLYNSIMFSVDCVGILSTRHPTYSHDPHNIAFTLMDKKKRLKYPALKKMWKTPTKRSVINIILLWHTAALQHCLKTLWIIWLHTKCTLHKGLVTKETWCKNHTGWNIPIEIELIDIRAIKDEGNGKTCC